MKETAKLYKVELFKNVGDRHSHHITFYVMAKDETDASNKALKTNSDYDYFNAYTASVEVVAEEGQYGNPLTLLL